MLSVLDCRENYLLAPGKRNNIIVCQLYTQFHQLLIRLRRIMDERIVLILKM
jgi:hypothetical protein